MGDLKGGLVGKVEGDEEYIGIVGGAVEVGFCGRLATEGWLELRGGSPLVDN